MDELVLDTNVLVTALRSRRGASYQLIRLIGTEVFRINVSVALALEYEEVLKRAGLIPGLIENLSVPQDPESTHRFLRTIKETLLGLRNEVLMC